MIILLAICFIGFSFESRADSILSRYEYLYAPMNLSLSSNTGKNIAIVKSDGTVIYGEEFKTESEIIYALLSLMLDMNKDVKESQRKLKLPVIMKKECK